jgi:hypothetical protein
MSVPKIKKTSTTTNFVSVNPDLQNWLLDFSAHLNTETDSAEEIINLPENFASGFAKVIELENGLTYRMVNYRLNTDFFFKREPAETFFLIIYFYQYSDCKHLSLSINNQMIVDSFEDKYSSLLMTNSLTNQDLFVSKNTKVQGLTIQITENWLKEKIAQPATSNYSLFEERKVFQTFLNPKSQK